MAERIRALWERLRADIQRNPGLWIGVGVSVALLVVAFLAYRKSQNSSQQQVPANGYGFPDYGSAGSSAGGGSSGGGLGYQPYQPSSLSSITPLDPSSYQTYNPSTPLFTPATAFPAYTLPATAYAALGTPQGHAIDIGVNSAPSSSRTLAQVFGSIQNPLAASQQAHRGVSAGSNPTPTVSGNIQNPSAASDIAHRGVIQPQQTSIQTPHIDSFIPTTVRPLPTPGRGRVA